MRPQKRNLLHRPAWSKPRAKSASAPPKEHTINASNAHESMQAVVPTPSNPVVNAGGGGCCAKICKECETPRNNTFGRVTPTHQSHYQWYIYEAKWHARMTPSRENADESKRIYIFIYSIDKKYIYIWQQVYLYMNSSDTQVWCQVAKSGRLKTTAKQMMGISAPHHQPHKRKITNQGNTNRICSHLVWPTRCAVICTSINHDENYTKSSSTSFQI
jgi:hypothetical protein